MTVAPPAEWVRPDNNLLLVGVCTVLAMLVAGPALFSIKLMSLVGPALLLACFALFSVRRTLILLLVANIVLPAKILMKLRLAGLQPQETIFLVAVGFALVDLVYRQRLAVKRTEADVPALAFLLVTLGSVAVGLLDGNPGTGILRDVRFPLYYGGVFLVTSFGDARSARQQFPLAIVLAGLVVSGEYILEFMGAIDLSTGTRFFRVARLHGVVLPIALLLLMAQFLYDPKRYGRWPLVALFLPIGLAFVLTVGRGMWVAFGVGLLTLAWLHHRGGGNRHPWRTAVLAVSLVLVLGGTVFLFQRFTGAAVGAHALERSRTFVDYQRDIHVLGRLFSYSTALETIAEQPLLGHGQGATLTFPVFNAETSRFEMWTVWTLDSLYLMLLWKMGIVGLVAAAWLALRILKLSYRTLIRAGDASTRVFAAGTTAVLVAMYTFGLSDGSMIHGRFALVFGALFGLVAVVAREPATGAQPQLKA